MQTEIKIGELTADVTLKDIKNIHLSVHPPSGRVKISAPERMDIERIRLYAISRLGWIRKQQAAFASQEREVRRRFVERETHYLFGKRYLLTITRTNSPRAVVRRHRTIDIIAGPDTSPDELRKSFEAFARRLLREEIARLIEKWSQRLDVSISGFGIKKMKTKWGSCNPSDRRIWFNLELAKKPIECIEYIVIHELVHLLERAHNHRFIAHMDSFLPQWRQRKQQLNSLPIGFSVGATHHRDNTY